MDEKKVIFLLVEAVDALGAVILANQHFTDSAYPYAYNDLLAVLKNLEEETDKHKKLDSQQEREE